MKFDILKAFPYPVLRPDSDDYEDAEFQTTVDLSIRKDKIKVMISYAISSNEIKEQIGYGHAEFVSVISCRDTFFQIVLNTKNNFLEKEFDINSMRGEVRVSPYVIAKEDISSYKAMDINPEFGPGPFSFKKGDVLAQEKPQVFYIDRDFFKPVTSVFELVKSDDLAGPQWTLSFDQDHVQIKVSSEMKEAIDNARNSKKNKAILFNSLYFAAVMQAIQKLKDTADNYEDYKWAEVILKQAHNKNIDLSSNDAYFIAECLMDYPLALLNTYHFRGED